MTKIGIPQGLDLRSGASVLTGAPLRTKDLAELNAFLEGFPAAVAVFHGGPRSREPVCYGEVVSALVDDLETLLQIIAVRAKAPIGAKTEKTQIPIVVSDILAALVTVYGGQIAPSTGEVEQGSYARLPTRDLLTEIMINFG